MATDEEVTFTPVDDVDTLDRDVPWPEIEDLPTPTIVHVKDNPEEGAKQIFQDALPDAAQAVVNIMNGRGGHSTTVNGQRLTAAKIVLERTLGRVKDNADGGWGDYVQNLMKDVQKGDKGPTQQG